MTDVVEEMMGRIDQEQYVDGTIETSLVMDLLEEKRAEIYQMENEQALNRVGNIVEHGFAILHEQEEN